MKIFQPLTAILCGSLLALSACSPKVENRGYVQDTDIKEQIVAGRDSKEDVMTVLGSPSALSNFGDDNWYYISTRKETVAFLAPEVVQQQVVRIAFDADGMVSTVETYDENQRQDVDVSDRVTPTEGHELGVLEQLLGNVGRFNTSGERGGPGARRR